MSVQLRPSVPSSLAALEPFVHARVLDPIDVHVTDWVQRAAGIALSSHLQLAIALSSWASQRGHSYADVSIIAEVVARELRSATDSPDHHDDTISSLPWPDPSTWHHELAHSPAAVVRQADRVDHVPQLDTQPVVLHGTRVYLQRHWYDECVVAASLRNRAVSLPLTLSPESAQLLDVLLPVHDTDPQGAPLGVSKQREAADKALSEALSVVVGGPGTGKTHTVALMLVALVHHELRAGRHPRIALAAPTGKARSRMQEAIARVLNDPHLAPLIPADVAAEVKGIAATTIHQLLGSMGTGTASFRYNAARPLRHDVVIIDETSMVATPLLAALCPAVRPDARLVLIGDPNQLESVDRGMVLGDLVAAAAHTTSPLHGRVTQLERSRRFLHDSAIGLMADAIRDRKPDEVLASRSPNDPTNSVVFFDAPDPNAASLEQAVHAEMSPVLAALRAAAEAGDDKAALEAVAAAKVLCAHREGAYGVSRWNALCERWLRGDHAGKGTWYAGRPVMITRNDHKLGLANGDTGVVVQHHHKLVAVFPTKTGVVQFDQAQLADVETAYAITIHKSQGSEYSKVVLILPPATSPLVGRELVYTAVTRAKQRVFTVGTKAAMQACLDRNERRMTGLADALST